MDCERIRREELMASYLSHGLEEALSDELETHILGCPGCSRLLDELQDLRDGVEERAASIRKVVTRPKVLRFWWQTAAVSAAVILIISFGVLRWRKVAKPSVDNSLASKAPPAEKVAQATPPNQSAPTGLSPELSPAGTPTRQAHAQKPASNASKGPAHAQPESPVVVASSPPKDAQPKDTESSRSVVPAEEHPVAVANNKGPEDATDGAHIKLTSAQGVELFQIGATEAAPFTFAGSRMFAKDPKGGPAAKSHPGTGPIPDTGRVLYWDGMTAYLESRYGDAIGFLQSALQTDKKTDDINFYLGVSQIMAGHPQEAEIPLRRVTGLGNSAYLQSAHYYLGKAYIQQVKLSQAESEFREAGALPGRLTADSKALLARIVVLRARIEAK